MQESYQMKDEEPDEKFSKLEQSKETIFENNNLKGNIAGLFGHFMQEDLELEGKRDDEVDKLDMISIELTK